MVWLQQNWGCFQRCYYPNRTQYSACLVLCFLTYKMRTWARWFLRPLMPPPFLSPSSWDIWAWPWQFQGKPSPGWKVLLWSWTSWAQCLLEDGGVFCGPYSLAPSCGPGVLLVTTGHCGWGTAGPSPGATWGRASPALFTHCTCKLRSSSPRTLKLSYFCQNPFQKSKSKLKVL